MHLLLNMTVRRPLMRPTLYRRQRQSNQIAARDLAQRRFTYRRIRELLAPHSCTPFICLFAF
jgi:hypothetical protein